MPMPVIDLTGQAFGRLKVLGREGTYTSPGGQSRPTWACQCECGERTVVLGLRLHSGATSSCGCLRRERLEASRHKGDEIKYGAAHRRVFQLNGSASNHRCIDCGKQAEDWSYVGGCPRERISDAGKSKGCAYSPDPDRYVARCKLCHKKYDIGQEAA